MLVLFTDTDTDITPSEAKYYGYHLISMPYTLEGKEIFPYVDFDTFDPHPFYQKLRDGILPTTSAISEPMYRDYFEPIFAEGNDILYVHFSRKLSATFAPMDRAVDALLKDYPDRHFYTIDTKGISVNSLIILKEIGDMYLEGKGIDEILEWADREVLHFATYYFVEHLRFFMHSGRVSNLTGTMGSLLGIRPIIYITDDGEMISIGKERGHRKAVDRLVHYVKDLGKDLDKHRIIITHGDAPEMAKELKNELLMQVSPHLNIEITNVNPTSGCHCGPDAIGVAFYAIHR